MTRKYRIFKFLYLWAFFMPKQLFSKERKITMKTFYEFKEMVEEKIDSLEKNLEKEIAYDSFGDVVPKSEIREELDRLYKINDTALNKNYSEVEYLIEEGETATIEAYNFKSSVFAAWLAYEFAECCCQIEVRDYVLEINEKCEPDSSEFGDIAVLHIGGEIFLRHKSDDGLGIILKTWEEGRKGEYGSEVYNIPIWETIDKYICQLSWSASEKCFEKISIRFL